MLAFELASPYARATTASSSHDGWVTLETVKPGMIVLHETLGEMMIIKVDPQAHSLTYSSREWGFATNKGRTAPVTVRYMASAVPRMAEIDTLAAKQLTQYRIDQLLQDRPKDYFPLLFAGEGLLEKLNIKGSLMDPKRVGLKGHPQEQLIRELVVQAWPDFQSYNFATSRLSLEYVARSSSATHESLAAAIQSLPIEVVIGAWLSQLKFPADTSMIPFRNPFRRFILLWFLRTGENLVHSGMLHRKYHAKRRHAFFSFLNGNVVPRDLIWTDVKSKKQAHTMHGDLARTFIPQCWSEGLEKITENHQPKEKSFSEIRSSEIHFFKEYVPIRERATGEDDAFSGKLLSIKMAVESKMPLSKQQQGLLQEAAAAIKGAIPLEEAQTIDVIFPLLGSLGERSLANVFSQVLSRELGKPLLAILKWKRDKEPQHAQPNLSRRLSNVAGTAVIDAKNFPKFVKHVLLVDDVCTTGASIEEVKRALSEAGAQRISVAVLALTSKAYNASEEIADLMISAPIAPNGSCRAELTAAKKHGADEND